MCHVERRLFDETSRIQHSRTSMQFKKQLFIVLLIASTALGAQPTTPTRRTLTLDECVRLALEHNLDIQIQRYNPQISIFQLDSSYGIYDPLFSLSGSHSSNKGLPGFDSSLGLITPGSDSETDSAASSISGFLPWGMSYNLGANLNQSTGNTPRLIPVVDPVTGTTNFVAQNFPFNNTVGAVGFTQVRQPLMKNFWIDASRLQISLDKRNLKGAELGFRQQVISTVTAVETAYYNLIYSYDQVKVQEKSVELAARLLTENQMRVKVGSLAPLDEKQAESALAARRADLLSAQANLSTAQNTLRALLTDDYSAWYQIAIEPAAKLVAVPVAPDLQDSWVKAMTQRPDLEQARLNVEKQDITLVYQKNQLFPQFDIVSSGGYNASSPDSFSGAFQQWARTEAPFYSFGAQFSVPLGNRTARNNYRAGKALKEQLVLQLKQLEQQALVAIDNSIVQVRSALERVTATREARVYAEAALDAEQKKLENGKSTSFEVLRLQNDLTSASSQEIRALADYNIALSALAQQEGTTLERNKIYWDVK
jgi:outer membrane protein